MPPFFDVLVFVLCSSVICQFVFAKPWYEVDVSKYDLPVLSDFNDEQQFYTTKDYGCRDKWKSCTLSAKTMRNVLQELVESHMCPIVGEDLRNVSIRCVTSIRNSEDFSLLNHIVWRVCSTDNPQQGTRTYEAVMSLEYAWLKMMYYVLEMEAVVISQDSGYIFSKCCHLYGFYYQLSKLL
jgi:hypothetical protein